jgi:hypothetical protein
MLFLQLMTVNFRRDHGKRELAQCAEPVLEVSSSYVLLNAGDDISILVGANFRYLCAFLTRVLGSSSDAAA